MTVTKQQQLEWLAKECDEWPFILDDICMSSESVGDVSYAVGSHRIAKQEWQQELDKMQKQQDNSWRERGELPPVGCECEIKHKCWSEFRRVTVAAITKEYVIVVDGQREQHYHLRDITFLPLRTEREKAIDEMVAVFEPHYGSVEVAKRHTGIAERLYDAGYRKVNP